MYISTARIHVSSHPVGRNNIFKILEFHDKIFGLVKNLLYLQCLFPVTSGEIQVIGFRISYAKIAQSVDKVPFLLVEFIRVVDDPPDVEVDDGLAAGDGFEEGEVIGIVMEKVLAECGGAKGVLQDVEVGFPVWISV